MYRRRLRSHSIAHDFPWEVLMAVCREADESTLAQLCLVSFGLLELAGPLLYQHVEISTVERLHSFFLKPSIISGSSRLRPSLGPDRVRCLSVDVREFLLERVALMMPETEWERPDRRVRTRIEPRHYEETGPSSNERLDMFLYPRLRAIICPPHALTFNRHFVSASSGSVDWSCTYLSGSSLLSDRIDIRDFNRDLQGAPRGLRGFLDTQLEPRSQVPQVALNLRRVDPSTLGPAENADLKALVRTCLDNTQLWEANPTLEVLISVATLEAEKLVQDVIAASSASEDRKNRCIVVRAWTTAA